jgi:hypothetical protein
VKRLLAALALSTTLVVPSFSATEKWVAGATSSWTAACGTEINSLAGTSTSNAVQCSTVIANGTNNDLYIKVSISLGSITTGAGSPYIGIYIYPLNEDGTTYGDGLFTSTAVGPPAANYMGCSIPAPISTTGVVVGSCSTMIPPTNFKIVVYNNLLINLAASANVVDFQTFNRQVN